MTKKEREAFLKTLEDAMNLETNAFKSWQDAKENRETWGFTESDVNEREKLYYYFEGKATALYLLKISMGL